MTAGLFVGLILGDELGEFIAQRSIRNLQVFNGFAQRFKFLVPVVCG